MSVQRRLKRAMRGERERTLPRRTAQKPAAPGRINQYTCEACGGVITTIDLHEGVTPMFLNCRATPGCTGRMHSSMYRVPSGLVPEYEWYHPTGKIKPLERQHVEMGGLLIRKIGGAS